MTGTSTSARLAPCERCKSSIEHGDLRCAACGLPVPGEIPADVAEPVAQVLRCDECGAAIAYDVEVQAPLCAFCGSSAQLEPRFDPLERADLYLPFRVSEVDARSALRTWLRGLSFLRPAGLQDQATLDRLEPVWWVGWSFQVETLVSFTADSNHGSRRSQWAPHSGQRTVTMSDVVVSASRGLTARETAALAPYFDLHSGADRPHELAETPAEQITVEQFDVQRSEARDIITEGVLSQARIMARAWIPGAVVRNLDVAVLPRRLHTRRLAFPTYVLAYRYRDKLYRALIHGQDKACVIGEAPWSIARLSALIGAALAVLGVVAWYLLSA